MISPLVCRRRLAAELKAAREAVAPRLTIEALGKRLDWSRSKANRIENVVGPPNVADVMKFLTAVGIEGKRWHKLVQIANDAAAPGWWTDFGEHMGARQAVNADLEWGAATIREYTGAWVPGLLQVANYTRARAGVTALRGQVSASYDVDRAIEARMTRQRMMRRPAGPQYEVIIDELILRRMAAPPEIMREQVTELVRLQEEDSQIALRVLPIAAEIDDYWLPNSAFSLYTYPDSEDPVMLAVEGEADDKIASDTHVVNPYVQLFDRLRSAALSSEASVDLMREAASKLP